MGDRLMKRALAAVVEKDLTGSASRLYLATARMLRDDDTMPTWWLGRSDTADLVNLSERAVDRAWAELIRHGLAARTVNGKPGQAANYALSFGEDTMTSRMENVRHERRTLGARTSHVRGADVAPRNHIQEPDLGTSGSTARLASESGTISSSQLSFYFDAYVTCWRSTPSAAQVQAVREGTPAEADRYITSLWREAHAEYRFYGEEIQYDDVRDSMQGDGSYELLSDEGRAKLDARVASMPSRTVVVAPHRGTSASRALTGSAVALAEHPLNRTTKREQIATLPLADMFDATVKGIPA